MTAVPYAEGPESLALGVVTDPEPRQATDGEVEPSPTSGVAQVRTGSRWFSLLRAVILVVVLAAGLIAWDLTQGSSPTYRTALVGTGTVEATLDSVGTITPVSQADLNFNVSGTVSAVDVSVGQTVTQGQTLASLDVAALNANVDSAQASVASAKATLASAEASETAATSTSSTAATASHTTTTSTTPTTSPAGSSGSSSTATVAPLQATLVADQSQLDADSDLAGTSLQQATAVCGSGSTPTTTTTSTTAPTSGGGAPTCSTALAQASSAQAKVAADIKQVAQDERALTAALESSGGSTGGSAGSSPPGSSGSAASTSSGTAPVATTSGVSSGSTPTSASGGQTTKKATPQQIAVDQASVDTAEANLTDAQQAVAGANLVTTIAGTVASVSIAAGDSVTAGSTSTTAQIVVIGKGSSYDLTTSIAVTDIGNVAIGQQASVTPDSTDAVVDGHVSAIGVVADSGSATTTYPVTISLDAPDLGELSGVEADVQIITQRSADVTTVPSSAVRTVGTIHLVTELKDGKPTPVRVTLGTVGDILTQVKSGVSKGDLVSLADLHEPLPSTSSTTARGGFGGLGAGAGGPGGFGGAAGFGGAGGFGGRFGG